LNAATRIKRLKEDAKEQQLVILVWGPGDPGAGGSREKKKYWEKRNQIRDLLSTQFPASQIYLSEASELRDHTRDLEDLLTEELVHAAVADCILVLDVSRGAHVEVDRFSTNRQVAPKLRILLPAEEVGRGLVHDVHKHLRVTGFTDDEFRRCSLASEKAINIVLSVALKKLMDSAGVPSF
jgi:hypothetical protein